VGTPIYIYVYICIIPSLPICYVYSIMNCMCPLILGENSVWNLVPVLHIQTS
jgi:hypothetical protein